MQRDLEGLHIIVTGGAGALGGAVVAELAAAGASIVVPCIDDGPSERVDGVRYVPRVDLAQETAVRALYDALPSLWGSVHLAGGFQWAKIEDTTAELARAQWTMNALTCLLCSAAAVKKIRASGRGGRIVNVTSRAVTQPAAGMTSYAMSKAAVSALTTTLAEELREEAILVNAIAPGIIDTPANRAAMPKADHDRWPKPAELARVIHTLVSPATSATSGAIVPVYGRS
ncbi:MAG TPA: SDR family NAD(P)-dependent oxidoreductase [Nannocystis sp.]